MVPTSQHKATLYKKVLLDGKAVPTCQNQRILEETGSL